MKTWLFAFALAALALAAPVAQEHDHSAPAAAKPAAAPAATAEPRPEIFCGTMKTGQLGSLGTATLLGLTPATREAWLTAVRTYNREVNAAITKLQAQSKTTLSPAQVQEVNSWFAIGINPQINQLLMATAKPAGAK